MNPRILELKKLATTTRYTGCGEIDELNLEKFAELIVEECIVIMNREIDEEESKEKNRTISDMMDLLEKHFGVSE